MGRPKGIVHCTYCKKQVIRGMDSYLDKNGRLQRFHLSCWKEINALQIQYAHLLLGNKCQCCGSKENIEAGHINFPKDKFWKDKNAKTGFRVASGDHPSHPKFLKLIETHAVIPVCKTCNMSMGNGSTCRVHQKYLGIWNYLPKLDDLESLPYYKALAEVKPIEAYENLQ